MIRTVDDVLWTTGDRLPPEVPVVEATWWARARPHKLRRFRSAKTQPAVRLACTERAPKKHAWGLGRNSEREQATAICSPGPNVTAKNQVKLWAGVAHKMTRGGLEMQNCINYGKFAQVKSCPTFAVSPSLIANVSTHIARWLPFSHPEDCQLNALTYLHRSCRSGWFVGTQALAHMV
jgi:hypothetical protein